MSDLFNSVFPIKGDEGGHLDNLISLELYYAGIPARRVPEDHRMHYTVVGDLNGLVFTREHRAWSAEGALPLRIAWKLFDAPGALVDFYLGSQGGFPTPEEKAVWLTPSGEHVRPTDEEAGHRAFLRKYPDSAPPLVFSDDPASIAEQFVTEYTITTYRGLRQFATTVRENS